MIKIYVFPDINDPLKQPGHYLCLYIGDLDELNWCLKKLSGKFVLKRSTVNILSNDGYNGDCLGPNEDQRLP